MSPPPRYCAGAAERPIWEYEQPSATHPLGSEIKRVSTNREGHPGCGRAVEVRHIPADEVLLIDVARGRSPMFRRSGEVVTCPFCDAGEPAPEAKTGELPGWPE